MKETIKIEIDKKYTTDLDTVITRENLLYLCENMALCALKRMIGYRGDYELRMYYNLLYYVGMKLGDTVIDRYNKQVTIKHACYTVHLQINT